MKTLNVLIVDGQGGGIGRQLVEEIKLSGLNCHITAVGTNTAATAAMLKAGAEQGATGENAVKVCCREADVIMGPVGIAIADSLLGEITPEMALAVGQSRARRLPALPAGPGCPGAAQGDRTPGRYRRPRRIGRSGPHHPRPGAMGGKEGCLVHANLSPRRPPAGRNQEARRLARFAGGTGQAKRGERWGRRGHAAVVGDGQVEGGHALVFR